MELLIKYNLEVKKMSKEELKKIVEGKTAEEQEMILSLLGEEKLLAMYGEQFMLETFAEANNARFAKKIMQRTGCKNVFVKTVFDKGQAYHITKIEKNS